MTREELEIGKYYTGGGEPIYKLVDIGTDWVLVIHYSTVHYVATSEFVSMEEFLSGWSEYEDDWCDDFFENDLVYGDWRTLRDKEYN